MSRLKATGAFVVIMLSFSTQPRASSLKGIALPGATAFPESVTSSRDGSLFVSSLANGGIFRIVPQSMQVDSWLPPGGDGTRSIFGVMVDEASQTLWACSNDISFLGVPGPSNVPGSFLKAFDLRTRALKRSLKLPGQQAICNDIAMGRAGELYVTDSLNAQILSLKPGHSELDVWATDPRLRPGSKEIGLDGIVVSPDGTVYVNMYSVGALYRVRSRNGVAGEIKKIETSRPLKSPDGMRLVGDHTLLLVEGSGKLDCVHIDADRALIETLNESFAQPTGVTVVGDTAWVTEGQLGTLGSLTNASVGPKLPFVVIPVSLRPIK